MRVFKLQIQDYIQEIENTGINLNEIALYQDGLQIPEKRYVYFAPTVRSFRLKRYKSDFS